VPKDEDGMNDLKKTIRRALVSQFRVKKNFDDDTGLFSTALIDSLNVMELVELVEGEIGVEIPPADITLENFDTVNRISKYVQKLSSEGNAS
jgi:acyl carrier protein